jgi:hypothetical protein
MTPEQLARGIAVYGYEPRGEAFERSGVRLALNVGLG